jgi:hypothetical protein
MLTTMDRSAKHFFAVSLLLLALLIISNLIINAEGFPSWGLPVALLALAGSLALWVILWLEGRQVGEIDTTTIRESSSATGALQLPQTTAREWLINAANSNRDVSAGDIREVQVPVPHSEIQADTSHGADKPPLTEDELNTADHDTAAPSREADTGELTQRDEDVAAAAAVDSSEAVDAAQSGDDQLAEFQVGEAMAAPIPDPNARAEDISGYNVGGPVDPERVGGPYDKQDDVPGSETPDVEHQNQEDEDEAK